jgi:CRP/FNR family transcriptional regulator
MEQIWFYHRRPTPLQRWNLNSCIKMKTTSHILNAFPFLQKPELEKEILENSTIMVAQKEEVIVRQGQYVKILPLVISGSIRVFQQVEDREVVLYYVQPGETCMMSLSSCFFDQKSPSQAVADEKTEILCVPTKYIQVWQKEYNEWNEFVLGTFRNRYDELLESFNNVVFKNIDNRLKTYLKNYSEKNGVQVIPLTHLQLANELGTTRVVISRILKQFESEKKVKLLRGEIALLSL